MDDYGNNRQTNGTVEPGQEIFGSIETVGDRDWFKTTLTAGHKYSFDLLGEANGNGTLGDPQVYLYNAAGQKIATDDDSGAGPDASLSFTPTVTGTYYVVAGEHGDDKTGTYTLRMAEDDFSDSRTGAGALALGTEQSGRVESAGDVDWFKVDLRAGQAYSVKLTTEFEGKLGAYNASGDLVQEVSGWSPGLEFVAPTAGTYYLAAQGTNEQQTGGYGILAAREDYVDDAGTSGRLADGSTVTGNAGYDSDRDWFQATLTAGTQYTIDLRGEPSGGGTLADPYLVLRDGDGNEIAANDDFNSLDSKIVFVPETSGTYFVDAGGLGGNTGTYTVSLKSGTVVFNGTDGDDGLYGTDFADIMNGKGGNDWLYAYGGNDTLSGNAGNDWLDGGDGDDVVSGGTGDDYLTGGNGNDRLTGGSGTDTAAYWSDTAGVTVSLAVTVAQDTGSSGIDTLAGIENLQGTDLADKLSGNALGNTLSGGGGNDVLDGRAGADVLDGSDGVDTVSYALDGVGVGVDLAAGFAKDGSGSFDTLRQIENATGSSHADTLTGDAAANVLVGLDGNDVLIGGLGADTLNGGGGADRLDGGGFTDRLTGGSGRDVFDFNAVIDSGRGTGADLITDFQGAGAGATVGDRIDLDGLDQLYAGNLTFVSTAAFTGTDQVRVAGIAGSTDTLVQVNLTGNGTPELEIRVVDGIATPDQWVAGDFIL